MKREFLMFQKRLRKHGYKRVRITGSHYIYKNEYGDQIAVNKDLSPVVERRLIREHDLY